MTTKTNIKIAPGAIVCEESKLWGDITVGAHTIVHPSAVINAEAGPIVIGEHCLIEEQAKIIHRIGLDKIDPDNIPVLRIGSHNVFEVDCTVEASKIGNSNVFESKCVVVGKKVSIPNGCIIGAGCRLLGAQALVDKTVIYGKNCLSREGLDHPAPQTLQMDSLAKILPNYHYIRKINKK